MEQMNNKNKTIKKYIKTNDMNHNPKSLKSVLLNVTAVISESVQCMDRLSFFHTFNCYMEHFCVLFSHL